MKGPPVTGSTRDEGPGRNVRTSHKPGMSPRVWALVLFVLALIPRLPGLRLFLTTDEPFFIQEATQVVAAFLGGDLLGTYWHFYPGVTISWLTSLGLVSQWLCARLTGATGQTFNTYLQGSVLDVLVAVRLPYVLLASGGVGAFYLLAQRSLGHAVAFLGALLMAFDPFFLAHSRVAHGDAPVSVFMGLSVLAFVAYLPRASQPGLPRASQPGLRERPAPRLPAGPGSAGRGGRRWLFLSAIMGALAALTKAPGQFMALFVIMVGVGDWLVRSWQLRRLEWRPRWEARGWLVDLLLWGGVAVFIFVALWPAMWIDPVGTLVRMIDETFGKVGEGHLVFFMGQPTLNPGPLFYPYVIPFRLTPVTLVGVAASLVVIAARLIASARGDEKKRLSHDCATALLLWVFVISLLLFGTLSPKKQDRYLLPLFPILDLLAGFAFVRIGESANQRIGKFLRDPARAANQQTSTMFVILSLILVVLHGLPVVTLYPYYLSYFNPLMGGLPRAVETTLVGWGEGMEKVAAYLNQQPGAEKLYVASVPAQTFLPYFKGSGENFYTNDVAMRADYVVLYLSQVQRLAPSPEIVNYFKGMEPEQVVSIRGVPYAWIYPGPRLITGAVPPGATLANIGLGDELRLAGYQILPLGSEDINLEVVLYWHALATISKHYTISVRLVAADGEWLAQHDASPANGLLPTSQWRQGDYVRDSHKLAATPDTAVDHVQIVVYDAANRQPLGAPIDLPLTEGHSD